MDNTMHLIPGGEPQRPCRLYDIHDLRQVLRCGRTKAYQVSRLPGFPAPIQLLEPPPPARSTPLAAATGRAGS